MQIRQFLCIAVAFCLVAMITGGASLADDAPAALRVMSFNIRYDNPNDGQDAWPLRREMLVETIRAYNPDLLGLQEVLHTQGQFLRDKLDGYKFVGVGRDDGKERGEYAPLMFRAERFELADWGTLWLSEQPAVAGSKSWDAALPRIATWCKLRDRLRGNGLLLVLNTHFDHKGEKARLESARLISKWLGEHSAELPVVVTGDFNCDDDSGPYQALVAQTATPALRDAYRAVHPARNEHEASFHAFQGNEVGTRIDWILPSQHFAAKSATIDRTNRQGRYPSDHFPVTAELVYAPTK